LAVDLHNGQGSACAAGQAGVWHFINNQNPGVPAGIIQVQFSTGTVSKAADKVTPGGVHHWTFLTSGATTLIGASSNLPNGNLNLSDFSCRTVKKPPPKK
jgi:hypothetical protein